MTDDQGERFVRGINTLLDTCNELAVVDGMSVREIMAVLSVVSIEVAKQSGEISRKDFLALTKHLAETAKGHLK